VHEPIEIRRVPLALVVLYVITWSVPLCCEYAFGPGLLNETYAYARRLM
jgi:hypothetical protein